MGFCMEEMGREGWGGDGAAGGAGGVGPEAEGQALLPEDDVDTGRGLGVGFLKAAKKYKGQKSVAGRWSTLRTDRLRVGPPPSSHQDSERS